MLRLAVLAESLAVVADDDDRGRRLHVLLERLHESPELLVHRRDLAEVRLPAVAAAEGLGRRRRERAGRSSGPRGRAAAVDSAAADARGPGPSSRGRRARRCPARQLVVVDVESAREAEAAGEHERRDEGGRAIAGLPEALGQDRAIPGQVAGVLVDAVPGGIEPGHHRGVRRQRLRNGRVGLAEAPASRRERVEGRRLDPRASGPIASARVVSSVTSRIDGRAAEAVGRTATPASEPSRRRRRATRLRGGEPELRAWRGESTRLVCHSLSEAVISSQVSRRRTTRKAPSATSTSAGRGRKL